MKDIEHAFDDPDAVKLPHDPQHAALETMDREAFDDYLIEMLARHTGTTVEDAAIEFMRPRD